MKSEFRVFDPVLVRYISFPQAIWDGNISDPSPLPTFLRPATSSGNLSNCAIHTIPESNSKFSLKIYQKNLILGENYYSLELTSENGTKVEAVNGVDVLEKFEQFNYFGKKKTFVSALSHPSGKTFCFYPFNLYPQSLNKTVLEFGSFVRLQRYPPKVNIALNTFSKLSYTS